LRKLIWPGITFLLTTALLSAGVWWWAYGTALERLSARGQTELSLATDRLQSYLQRFRQLSVVLADHPSLIALLNEDSDQFVTEAERLLLRTADKTGSLEVFVLSSQGFVVASSRGTPIGSDFSNRAYFRRAMNGALGTAQGIVDAERAFYAAAPIIRQGGAPIGAVVVKVDIEAVETDWRANPNILYFTDRLGVVFVANRFELLFRSQSNSDDQAARARKYPAVTVQSFPAFRQAVFRGFNLWQFPKDGRFPASTLHLAADAPVIDLTAEILIDTAPAKLSAALLAAFAGATLLVLGAILLLLTLRRMALAEQLRLEEHANQELEARVERRTEQLSGVNLDLRQQIKERHEAEEALRIAQQDLVQAGKLTALGQMSAGISHELNQPLMAIRSFADNAVAFLERGDSDTAKANLARISDLARRMGRIIKNLRAFTRKEGEPMTDVDLVGVVELVLELSEQRLVKDSVAVKWQAPAGPVMVRGGDVRLQQVLLNLVSNGVDAMEGQADKQLEIAITQAIGSVKVSVCDCGPGLDESEKIFDPFYTTKAVGSSEGMGLGLSISYGIVQSFGGKITGRNHPKGGAEFTVELTPVRMEKVA
jgi:two-component system, NtrC family, C4-dicarboxylate transport sensor histidine kinase DctB